MRLIFWLVAVLLLLAMIVAWFVFANFSGRFSYSAGELAFLVVRPGQFVDAIASKNPHAGFGDWRDFVNIVFVSWFTWLIPIYLVWKLFERFSSKSKD